MADPTSGLERWPPAFLPVREGGGLCDSRNPLQPTRGRLSLRLSWPGLPILANSGAGWMDGQEATAKMAASIVAQQPRYPLVGESLQQLLHRAALANRSGECTEFI